MTIRERIILSVSEALAAGLPDVAQTLADALDYIRELEQVQEDALIDELTRWDGGDGI